jgi:hypothetical protein
MSKILKGGSAIQYLNVRRVVDFSKEEERHEKKDAIVFMSLSQDPIKPNVNTGSWARGCWEVQ